MVVQSANKRLSAPLRQYYQRRQVSFGQVPIDCNLMVSESVCLALVG